MPINIRDVDGGLGVLITATGILTDDEFTKAIRQHLAQDQEKYRRYRFCLADYSGVTEDHVSSHTIRAVASMCKSAADVNPKIVVADVAKRNLEYGLSRMWEILCDETAWETRTFRSSGEARKWITGRVKERWNITDIAIRST